MFFLVLAVIAVNVIVSMRAFKLLEIGRADEYLFIPYEVSRGHNGKGALLSNFAHSGWGHLFFNMLTLFFFAPVILGHAGGIVFLIIYVIAGMGSMALVYLMRRNDPSYRCLGASGSVVGILFAAIVFEPGMILRLFFAIPIPAPIYGILYLVISTYMMRSSFGGISHEAHVGGAILGFVAAVVVSPYGLTPLIETVIGYFR
jgi:membrane associated rhomboid family serine protease